MTSNEMRRYLPWILGGGLLALLALSGSSASSSEADKRTNGPPDQPIEQIRAQVAALIVQASLDPNSVDPAAMESAAERIRPFLPVEAEALRLKAAEVRYRTQSPVVTQPGTVAPPPVVVAPPSTLPANLQAQFDAIFPPPARLQNPQADRTEFEILASALRTQFPNQFATELGMIDRAIATFPAPPGAAAASRVRVPVPQPGPPTVVRGYR